MQWYPCCGLVWPLLLFTATQACNLPSFLRFDRNQVWLSTWRRDSHDPHQLQVMMMAGQGQRMSFYTQSFRCVNGKCRQATKDRLKSKYVCKLKIGKRHAHRYLVESQGTATGKIFCVEFITRDTLTSSPDMKIFYLKWDQTPYHIPRRDQECNFKDTRNDFQDVWIPSLKQERSWWNNCPIQGGFQARVSKGRDSRPLCPDERLFRFDVECVSGEGMMWVFPNANCNPFASALETQFYCYIAWRNSKYTNVILYNTSSISQVYTMRYETTDINTIFDLLSSRRRSFYKAYIFYGAVELSIPPNQVMNLKDPRSYYSLEYRIGNPQDPDCDDEVINCAQRCHETRAYINCKKTCSRPREECMNNRDNNNCKFRNDYISKWSVESTNNVEFITFINEKQIEFFRPNGRKQLRAQCYNEIQSVKHSLNDRYVIEIKDMPKGCRRRRLCLELYQGRYIMTPEKNNKNTLRYRISRSKIANLYTDHNQLCKFQPDPQPLGERYRSKFMKIMVSKEQAQDANNLPSKCGLYRSMRASVKKYPHQCDNVTVNDWSPQECEFHSQLHIDHSGCKGGWSAEDRVHNYQCISTFYTSHLGLTVSDSENNNIQLHITRNMKNNEYNCWFFDRTSVPSKLYKFPTSDCAIWHQTQYRIIVDESKASVVYTITGTGAQPCHRRQEIIENPNDESPGEIPKITQRITPTQRELQYSQHLPNSGPRGFASTLSCELSSLFALTFYFLSWMVMWLL